MHFEEILYVDGFIAGEEMINFGQDLDRLNVANNLFIYEEFVPQQSSTK